MQTQWEKMPQELATLNFVNGLLLTGIKLEHYRKYQMPNRKCTITKYADHCRKGPIKDRSGNDARNVYIHTTCKER